jgi:predicted transcriptional regulator
MKRVAEVMSRPLITVKPDTGVGEVARIAAEHGIRHLAVVASRRVAGVVCTCDLREASGNSKVAQFMKAPVFTIAPTADLLEAADVMRRHGIGCLPITDGDALIGMLTRGDLLRAGLAPEQIDGLVCAACHGRRHVRRYRRLGGVALCCECFDTSSRHEWEEDTGCGD